MFFPDGCCRVDTNPTLDDVRRCGCDYKDTYMYTEGDADDDGNIASEEDDAPEEADEPNRRKTSNSYMNLNILTRYRCVLCFNLRSL